MDKDTFEAQREMISEGSPPTVAAERMVADAHFERLVHQAEVSMDKLTGSAEWDSFVQIVQSRIETAKDDYEHMAYELAHPSFRIDIEGMSQARIELAQLHSTIAALEWITELPREIMDEAKAAGLDDDDVEQTIVMGKSIPAAT